MGILNIVIVVYKLKKIETLYNNSYDNLIT